MFFKYQGPYVTVFTSPALCAPSPIIRRGIQINDLIPAPLSM